MKSDVHRLLTPTAEERSLIEQVHSPEILGDESALRDLFARVVWARLIEPGDKVAVQLVESLGSVSALAHVIARTDTTTIMRVASENGGVELVPGELTAALKRWQPRLDRTGSLQDLHGASQHGMKILVPADLDWPSQVDDLDTHRPLALWVRGRTELLRQASLAIVGARACSTYGQEVTAEISEAAVQRGMVVVSGAAFGIDGVAHRAALASGGTTLAVLAGGADRLYPQAHARLLHTIMAEGAVVAETIPGAPPTRWRFLMRNRIIAALAQATVVTEAGRNSGSINTAGHAAHIGRELAAVPGSIHSAGSHGCFRIIEDYGAKLLTRMSDLDDLLGASVADSGDMNERRQPSAHQRTLDALPLRGSRNVPDIVRHAGLNWDEVILALVELELLGAVERLNEGSPGESAWKLVPRTR